MLLPVLRRWFGIGILGCVGVLLNAGVKDIYPHLEAAQINAFLNAAQPGDTLLFHPGGYTGPFFLNDVHGVANNPIVIKGPGSAGEGTAMIDGKSKPGMYLRNQAFLLQNCSWVTIENFTIKNCWTDLIRAEDVAYRPVIILVFETRIPLRGCVYVRFDTRVLESDCAVQHTERLRKIASKKTRPLVPPVICRTSRKLVIVYKELAVEPQAVEAVI